MKLYNLDLHISVIQDIINILKQFQIDDQCISGHHWVMNKSKASMLYVNENTWKNLSLDMINNFKNYYHNFLKEYDGFIVTHTPIFALLFEDLNKPILIINSCRFDQPFCWNNDKQLRNYFIEKLQSLNQRKLLYVISNNRGDMNYFKHETNIDTIWIPSICEYTLCKEMIPKYDLFIIYSNESIFFQNCNWHHELKIIPKTLLGKYKWKKLFSMKAIIHIPYEISTMSIFEQYSSGVPLFFPTKKFLKELHESYKILKTLYFDNDDYINNKYNDINTWIDNSDFYVKDEEDIFEMKYIYYYDSWSDLKMKLTKFEDVYRNDRIKHIQNRNLEIKNITSNIAENLFYSK
jgi:hypothetical protein